MAKKKATMTLKDFHGGSIPSDLPLPSAPGIIVRQQPDRQNPWGNQAGRSDHRLRPGSAGAVKNLEDRTPFFTNNVQIGRNFDEDERKPLDGGSGSTPRRTISDESIQALPKTSSNRPSSRPASSGSYTANNNNNNNAWGLRKEIVGVIKEPVSVSSSGGSHLNVVSKLAHASALEKVSSGRWHSKQQIDIEPDKVITTNTTLYKASGVIISPKDDDLVKHTVRSLNIDDKIDERPKLKLLPRSKPLENNIEPPQLSGPLVVVKDNISHETMNSGVARPKLNLKPRSQAFESLEGNSESNRSPVFGSNNTRQVFPRVKQEMQKSENNRTVKNGDNRRDSWRNENWRNTKDGHAQQQPPPAPPQERQPSPETWRKPVEQPQQKPASPDGPRKVASAIELAQAFSKSVSEPGSFTAQKGLPGRGQVPFSRLTGPSSSPRPQINGY